MKKTAVIYWSGTGNTKQMAEAVLEGMTDCDRVCDGFRDPAEHCRKL